MHLLRWLGEILSFELPSHHYVAEGWHIRKVSR